MPASTARVVTERPAEYAKQLCAHFADAGQRHGSQEFDAAGGG